MSEPEVACPNCGGDDICYPDCGLWYDAYCTECDSMFTVAYAKLRTNLDEMKTILLEYVPVIKTGVRS